MGIIASSIESFLKEDEWKYEQFPDRATYHASLQGKTGTLRLIWDAKEDRQQIYILAISQLNVPENKRLDVAEFILRANYGMCLGNFEMDMNDGEVRFRVSADVEHCSINSEMVKQMTYLAALMMDRYFPGIIDVCYANNSASDAVDKIEKEQL